MIPSPVLPLLLAIPAHAGEGEAEAPLVVELELVELGRALVPGFGLTDEPPGEAWSGTIDGWELRFVDLDGDGELGGDGRTGLAFAGPPFVLALPGELLLPGGPSVLVFEERVERRRHRSFRTVRVERVRSDVDPGLLAQASRLTLLRARAGLPLVELDEDACRAAALHLSYLHANGFGDGAIRLAAHDEVPGQPGFTLEGRQAGRSGNLGFTRSLEQDLDAWAATAFHAVTLLDPCLEAVGVAHDRGISLCYFARRREPCGAGERVFVHPADGARDVPLAFNHGGEVPEPYPGTNGGIGLGYPVFVRLPESAWSTPVARFVLTDARGKEVAGYVTSPQAPAAPSHPDNAGAAFFLPTRPLRPATRYTATFALAGEDTPRVWSFETRP